MKKVKSSIIFIDCFIVSSYFEKIFLVLLSFFILDLKELKSLLHFVFVLIELINTIYLNFLSSNKIFIQIVLF